MENNAVGLRQPRITFYVRQIENGYLLSFYDGTKEREVYSKEIEGITEALKQFTAD